MVQQRWEPQERALHIDELVKNMIKLCFHSLDSYRSRPGEPPASWDKEDLIDRPHQQESRQECLSTLHISRETKKPSLGQHVSGQVGYCEANGTRKHGVLTGVTR